MSKDITDQKIFPLELYLDKDFRPVETKAEAYWIDQYNISKEDGPAIKLVAGPAQKTDPQ